MQNKGFIKVIAVLLTLICIYYLSFSFVTSHYTDKAAKMGEVAGAQYLDSIKNEKVWLGAYTFKQCQEMQIGLGLDLKGGMNVILEVSVPDVVKSLADNSIEPNFVKAVQQASQEAQNSQDDFITLFVKDYQALAGKNHLAEVFATQQLKGQVATNSTDSQIEKVLRKEVAAAIDNSYKVLRTRIDRFGVAQPNIQTLQGQMGRILVEMPGIKEPDRVRKLLQGSANLEFWETYDGSVIIPYLSQIDGKLASSSATVKEDSTAKEEAKEEVKADEAKDTVVNAAAALKKIEANKDKSKADAKADADLKKQHPLLASISPAQGGRGCVVGYVLARDTAEVMKMLTSADAQKILPKDLKLCWGVKPSEISTKQDVFELYALKVTERNGRAPLEGDVITTAKDDYDQFHRPCVSMSMNTDGARRWAAITKKNKDHAIAIVLDGFVYSAPNVENEINGGQSQITGHFTAEDTKDRANVLQSGKIPAPAHIVQEDIVGPSLGQESIIQGFTACVIAFVLLMIYMCAIYGMIPGMVANTALLLNFFFTFGVLTSFQAALTMSGIAGMVLSLGMAVDANVLIYERTKEELRAGKLVKSALSDGYKHAFSAIFDSNLTSIITAIILFNFGTGPIRGFATTLIIGLLASFFTAVWLTRIAYEHFMNKDKWLHITFTTNISKNMMRDPHYNILGFSKKVLGVCAAFIVVVLISFAVRGLSKGIDFTGGRNFVVQFEQKVTPEEVRDLLQKEVGEEANVSAISLGTDGKTLRVSTNYDINNNSADADAQVEKFIYQALVKGHLLADYVTLERFVDRDNRAGGSIISSQKVGPSVAKDVTYGAIVSVILALAAIFLYILARFRNVAYSVGSTVALAIDTLLIIGMYSLCWGWVPFSLEVDQTFIGAVLTAIGYSINDKVVIFDRVREYFHLYPKRDNRRVYNDALNSTLSRTINTGGTTLVVLLCIFIFGGESIRSFAFAMILGVIFGTLSSLYVASPIAYLVMKRTRRATANSSSEAVAVEAKEVKA